MFHHKHPRINSILLFWLRVEGCESIMYSNGWNIRGSDLGCCGHSQGCCLVADVSCFIHDHQCKCCHPKLYCGPACEPEPNC